MADINNLTVLPRPRSAWQAMDAGFILARAHYVKLILLWLLFSLPVLALCLFLLLEFGWTWILILWWWFKPLYELPMHIYLSRALFSENITLGASWKLTLQQFWPLFRSYLTIARLSPARALSYGVVFLEKLFGSSRSARLRILKIVKTRHYLLMLVCLHIEYLLTYGLVVIFVMMFDPGSLGDADWVTAFQDANFENTPLNEWVLLTTIATVISAALVAPFYVAGGFLLYINRRMQLEAWDIEHRFRAIKSGSASAVTALVLVAVLAVPQDNAWAQDRASNLPSENAVQASIEEIKNHEEFGTEKMKKGLKLKEKEAAAGDDNSRIRDALEWFFGLLAGTAGLFKVFLWFSVGVFILLLLYTISRFKRPSLNLNGLSRGSADNADAKSHPLTQDLPNDIVTFARDLLNRGEKRQALSVLFRGALRSVMTQYDLKIARGATESDCQQEVSAVANNAQTQMFTRLLGVWQKEAYANQPQETEVIGNLINEWHSAFESGNSVSKGTVAS